jgi:hypothetical protein
LLDALQQRNAVIHDSIAVRLNFSKVSWNLTHSLRVNYKSNQQVLAEQKRYDDLCETAFPDLPDTLASSTRLSSKEPPLQKRKSTIFKSEKAIRCQYSVRKILTSASRFLSPLIRPSPKLSVPSSHQHKAEDDTATVQQFGISELPSPLAEISSSAYCCTELDCVIPSRRATDLVVALPLGLEAYPNQQPERTEQTPLHLASNANNYPTRSSEPFSPASLYPSPLFSPYHNLANSSRSMQNDNPTVYTLPETHYPFPPDTSRIEPQTDGCNLSCSTELCKLFERALQNSTWGSLDLNVISQLKQWLDAHQALIADCRPEIPDLREFLARTSDIDLVLGPWLRSDQSAYRCIQATDIVVIQQLLRHRFGQTEIENCHGTDGNALCGLWFLRSMSFLPSNHRSAG